MSGANKDRVTEFRVLTEDDLDSVLELEKESFSTPWTREQYSLLLKAGVCRLFGASNGLEVLAYACVSMSRAVGELEIYNIAVRPDKRRQGLGKELLAAVINAAGGLGINRAVLEVREGNVAAIALYEALEFRPVGKRRNYYTEPDEDALVFEYLW